MPQGPGMVPSGGMGGQDAGWVQRLNRQLGSGLRGVGQGTPESNRQRQASLIQEKLSHLMPIAQRLATGEAGGLPQHPGGARYAQGMGDTADDNSMQIIQLLLRALGSQAQPLQPPPERGLEIGPELAPQVSRPDATAQAQVSKLFR